LHYGSLTLHCGFTFKIFLFFSFWLSNVLSRWLHPPWAKLKDSWFKFVDQVQYWKKEEHSEKMVKISGCFEIWSKSSLWFFYFSNYKLSIFIFFWKFHFGSKFYFSYFWVPSLREDKESGWISVVKRESLSWHRFRPWKGWFWC
jgi:hypothetical protein